VSQLLERLQERPVRGEITVLVGMHLAAEGEAASAPKIQEEVKRVMTERKLDERAALKVVARARGISRSEAYRLLQMEKSTPQ
jgi:16S rRNA (cytidine1402-2'-O)-methyltransferase